MRSFRRIAVLGCLLAVITGAQAADDAYVISLYAKVNSATSFPSKTIVTLQKGTKVTVTAVQGNWSAVTLSDGRSGFMSSRHLDEDPPSGDSAAAQLGRMSRSEGGSVAGTAGGRGVGPVATNYARSKNAGAALADVEWVETLPLNTEQLDEFMGKGAVGDYQQ